MLVTDSTTGDAGSVKMPLQISDLVDSVSDHTLSLQEPTLTTLSLGANGTHQREANVARSYSNRRRFSVVESIDDNPNESAKVVCCSELDVMRDDLPGFRHDTAVLKNAVSLQYIFSRIFSNISHSTVLTLQPLASSSGWNRILSILYAL